MFPRAEIHGSQFQGDFPILTRPGAPHLHLNRLNSAVVADHEGSGTGRQYQPGPDSMHIGFYECLCVCMFSEPKAASHPNKDSTMHILIIKIIIFVFVHCIHRLYLGQFALSSCQASSKALTTPVCINVSSRYLHVGVQRPTQY